MNERVYNDTSSCGLLHLSHRHRHRHTQTHTHLSTRPSSAHCATARAKQLQFGQHWSTNRGHLNPSLARRAKMAVAERRTSGRLHMSYVCMYVYSAAGLFSFNSDNFNLFGFWLLARRAANSCCRSWPSLGFFWITLEKKAIKAERKPRFATPLDEERCTPIHTYIHTYIATHSLICLHECPLALVALWLCTRCLLLSRR